MTSVGLIAAKFARHIGSVVALAQISTRVPTHVLHLGNWKSWEPVFRANAVVDKRIRHLA